MAQIDQERVLRGQEGVLVDHLQCRSDSDGCMVVMVVMMPGDIRPIVDPKKRFPLGAVSHTQLQASAARLQGLDQPSEVCSTMDLVIQQVGAVGGAERNTKRTTSNLTSVSKNHMKAHIYNL